MTDIIVRVRALHQQLLADARYKQFVVATTDAEAIQGGLKHDTLMAALMIRAAASDGHVAMLKLTDICALLDKIIGRPSP